jgi:hypothetical protein
LVYWTRPTTGKTNRAALTAAGLLVVGFADGFRVRGPGPSRPG